MTRLGLLGPAQLCRLARSSPVTWAGRGPAQKKYKKIYKIFFKIISKICDVLKLLLLHLDQYGLYFYMVKIQVRYENTRFSSRHQKKYIKCKMFCFQVYGQYPNIVFYVFLSKKQIFEVSKMCFRMDFLNTTKIIFLAFLDFTTCL